MSSFEEGEYMKNALIYKVKRAKGSQGDLNSVRSHAFGEQDRTLREKCDILPEVCQ